MTIDTNQLRELARKRVIEDGLPPTPENIQSYYEYFLAQVYGHEQIHVRNKIGFAKWMKQEAAQLPSSIDCVPCTALRDYVEKELKKRWKLFMKKEAAHEWPFSPHDPVFPPHPVPDPSEPQK